MTQEDKELLLKDLCARLPYEVRCKFYNVYENCYEEGTILGFERKEYIEIGGKCVNVEEVRPYLFPLSSMTEEQKEELKREISKQTDILIERMKNDDCGIDCGKYHFHSLLELEWCVKNHFDYRGLIPKGLAIDATGLNIY